LTIFIFYIVASSRAAVLTRTATPKRYTASIKKIIGLFRPYLDQCQSMMTATIPEKSMTKVNIREAMVPPFIVRKSNSDGSINILYHNVWIMGSPLDL